jgi:uncharacterized membrane protein YebE (DUF533 family)
MKKMYAMLTALGLTLSLSATTFASGGSNTPIVDKREKRQQKRIKDGLRNGSLTKKEALRLEVEQARIRNMERKAKADGVVTFKERAKLQRELNQSSRHIRNKKHN